MAKILPSQIKHPQRFIKESPYPGVQNEKGWMLATIAMMIPLAIIALAFVIDLGNTYRIKEKVKYASDAALVAVGRVYPERPEIHDNGPEVRRLLKKMFLFNLISNGMDVGPDSFVGIPEYNFEKNTDGSYDIGIKASYIVETFYSDVFGLFPGGGEFAQLQGTTTSSTYRLGKKKLIVGILIDHSQSVGDDRLDSFISSASIIVQNTKGNDYFGVNAFDYYWDDTTNGRHQIASFAKVPADTSSETDGNDRLRFEIRAHRIIKERSPSGTYLQGALYRMKNDMNDFIANNPTLENWSKFRKIIIVFTDGAFSKRSKPSDDLSIYRAPYDQTYDFAPSEKPMAVCGSYENSNPITIYEADQIRKSGIILAAFCSENCEGTQDANTISRVTMNRLANVPLIKAGLGHDYLPWQTKPSNNCYIPYLTSGEEKIRDPNANALTLPLGVVWDDLYGIVDSQMDPSIGSLWKPKILLDKIRVGDFYPTR